MRRGSRWQDSRSSVSILPTRRGGLTAVALFDSRRWVTVAFWRNCDTLSSLALIPLSYGFDNRRPSQARSLATRAADAQGGDPAFVSFFLLPLALVVPSFCRTRPSSHRLSIAPAGSGIEANTHLCVAFRLNCDTTAGFGRIDLSSASPVVPVTLVYALIRRLDLEPTTSARSCAQARRIVVGEGI
jgi:hypothetical protein